jgi:hypothetical protein
MVLTRLKLLETWLTEITGARIRKLTHLLRSGGSHIFLFISSLITRLLGYCRLTQLVIWSVGGIAVVVCGAVELLGYLNWHSWIHLLITCRNLWAVSVSMTYLRELLH